MMVIGRALPLEIEKMITSHIKDGETVDQWNSAANHAIAYGGGDDCIRNCAGPRSYCLREDGSIATW